MAHDHDFLIRVEFLGALRHFAHRDVQRSGYLRHLQLVRLAHIEQDEALIAGGAAAGDLGYFDGLNDSHFDSPSQYL